MASSDREQVFKNELELQHWFRRNLQLFDLQYVLERNLGSMKKSSPDFWALRVGWETMMAREGLIRIEAEAMSYNFVLHKHAPADVDFVLCGENNLALYGIEALPAGTPILDLAATMQPNTQVRCLDRLMAVLRKYNAGDPAVSAAVGSMLAWWQPETAGRCHFCDKRFTEVTVTGAINWQQEWRRHPDCLPEVRAEAASYLRAHQVQRMRIAEQMADGVIAMPGQALSAAAQAVMLKRKERQETQEDAILRELGGLG